MDKIEYSIKDNDKSELINQNMEEDVDFYQQQQDQTSCCGIQKCMQLFITALITAQLAFLWQSKCMPIYRKIVMRWDVNELMFIKLRQTNDLLKDGDYVITKGLITGTNSDGTLYPRKTVTNADGSTSKVAPPLAIREQTKNQPVVLQERLEQMCSDRSTGGECLKWWMEDPHVIYTFDDLTITSTDGIVTKVKDVNTFVQITSPRREVLDSNVTEVIQEYYWAQGRVNQFNNTDVTSAILAKQKNNNGTHELQSFEVRDIFIDVLGQSQEHLTSTMPIVFENKDDQRNIVDLYQQVIQEEYIQLVLQSILTLTCLTYQCNTCCKPVEDETGIENILYQLNKERQEENKRKEAEMRSQINKKITEKTFGNAISKRFKGNDLQNQV